jgi:hypothetical protein
MRWLGNIHVNVGQALPTFAMNRPSYPAAEIIPG